MATISVTHVTNDRFRVGIRGYELVVDQPGDGAERGPTPTELFVASLASCAGHYAVRFLRRHQLAHEGLRVECDWTMLAARPARVGKVRLRVAPPEPVPEELLAQLEEAIGHCTVHNSLRQPPPVTVELVAGQPAAPDRPDGHVTGQSNGHRTAAPPS